MTTNTDNTHSRTTGGTGDVAAATPPPPMPLDQWRKLVEFDRRVKAETGHSFLDNRALTLVAAYSKNSYEPIKEGEVSFIKTQLGNKPLIEASN